MSAICQNMVNNDSITFKAIRRSADINDDGVIVGPTFFIKTNLKDEELDQVRKLSKLDRIKLLSDDKTDWAANIILYSITHRDGYVLFISSIKSRSEWIKSGKYEKDISYWKKNLK